jgi:gliding motility-associated lipoprotein GldH
LRYITLSYILVMFMSSCTDNLIYSEKADIPEKWMYSDSIEYNFVVSDTIPAYDITMNTTHDTDFGFGNMYILVRTRFPDGRIVTGPLSLNLADQRGQWSGKCDNHQCDAELMLSEKIFFSQPGIYTITVNQHSRAEVITGIRSMTLKVKKHSS